MAGDSFTRNKNDAIDRMVVDSQLSHFEVRCGVLIVGHMNRTTGDAWPAQETIAKALGATERGVRKAVSKLIEAGYLDATPSRGRGHSIRYRLVKTRNHRSAFNGENPEPTFPFSEEKPGTGVPETRNHRSEKPGTGVPETRNHRSEKPGTGVPTNHMKEPSEEPSDKRGAQKRRTGVPENWPTQKDLNWARDHWNENGRSDLADQAEHHAEQCRDYHQGKGTVAADWAATWRTWARKAPDFNKQDQRHATGAMSAVAGAWLGYEENDNG